ncbi:hypothetical protein [Methanobrevibacter sp.]|uniref:DUF6712 family protein n=1 Tax=Methanobrevibacter sp. TaxID=66852 RepID=UPI00386627E8
MLQNTIINEKWLKEFSPIPLNYNMKELHNYVKLAEAIWLVPIIGNDFYDELLEQVAENNLSDENSTALVEAIYPYLGFAVAYEALPVLWAHISEVGITKGKSDNSDSLDLKDMTYVSQHLRTQVEARKDYCKKWLCERNESFPLLNCCACGCSCCNDNAKLNYPNPMKQLYTTNRKCADLI